MYLFICIQFKMDDNLKPIVTAFVTLMKLLFRQGQLEPVPAQASVIVRNGNRPPVLSSTQLGQNSNRQIQNPSFLSIVNQQVYAIKSKLFKCTNCSQFELRLTATL